MKKLLFIGCLVLVKIVCAQQIEIAVQKGHSGDVLQVSFNEDATLLASAGADHLIKLWHVPTGKEMASFSGTIPFAVTGIRFIQDSEFLLVTYAQGSVEKWNVATSTLEGVSQGSTTLKNGAYTSQDKTYSVEIEKFYIRKKSQPSGRTIFSRVPVDISKKFNAIAVSETFNVVLAANEDGAVYAYSLASGKNIGLLEDHYASVNAVFLSMNNALFATASSDRSIIIWDTKTLKPLKRLFGKSFRYEAIKFNHAGDKLAVGDELGFGRIIDLQSSRIRVSAERWHDQKISGIRFSSDDSLVYSGAHDNRLAIYNLRTQKLESKEVYKRYISIPDFILKTLGAYREPYAWINSLDVSPEGNNVAMGGSWRESAIRRSAEPLRVRDAKGTQSAVVYAHQGGINDILFLNEREFLSAGSNVLVRWRYDASGRIFFRDKKMPVPVINRILRGPANTIVIQSSDVLIHYDVEGDIVLDSLHVSAPITAMTVNPATGQIVYAMFDVLVFSSLSSLHNQPVTVKGAHSDKITSIDFNPAHPTIATCSWDATVKLWDAEAQKLLATIIAIGADDHIIVTPDNYYYGTKGSLQGLGFKYGKVFISPEQFDLRFNRPDVVLDRIGYVPKQIVRSFHRAYIKRLQKMNFTEEMLSEEVHMPVTELAAEDLPLNSPLDEVSFTVRASDSKYRLDRINVFVNNVPAFGTNGLSLRNAGLQETAQRINLKLSAGRNKIQVSCMNEKGVESLLQTAEVIYQPPRPTRPNLYLAVISVSRYANPSMNLKYARKDGQDIVSLFKRSGWYENVFVDTVFDERATLENIQRLHSFFSRTGTEDEVVCFVSGHGLLDQNLDFYFATHDINFRDPAARGLRYEALEALLDGIPARKKLLLMDACHSGEVDRSRIQSAQLTADIGKNRKGTVTSYSYSPDTETENYRIGITTSFELMQEVFANVTKGSGAIVISAAAGNSYALESDEWRNGVFTFSLLSGVKNRTADKNKDRAITVTELKDFISSEVEALTQGEQRPTSRSENLEFDFRVW